MVIESYGEVYFGTKYPKRKKRKKANQYDPNAKESDIRYSDNYGL